MKKRTSAFTVLEIITVTLIVAVVAGLVAPTLVAAKLASKKATSISNLHQCGIALLLYVEQNDDGTLPSFDLARTLLGALPTCDPAESWRKSCSERLRDPMIGSYGYIRGTPLFQDEQGARVIQLASNPIVMISIFYARYQIPQFQGDQPPLNLCQTAINVGCRYPSGLIGLRYDSSASILRVPLANGQPPLFSWTAAFLSDNGDWIQVIK